MNISIPYNNDLKLIDEIHALGLKNENTNIIFYFAPSTNITRTGRRLPNQQNYMKNGHFDFVLFERELGEFLQRCKQYHFKTCVLFNDILFGMPYNNEDLKNKVPKIQNYLEYLDKEHLTDYVCIANPYLLELINWKRIKALKVKASVNFQIKSERTINILNCLVKDYFPDGSLAEVEIQKDLLRNIENIAAIRAALDPSVQLSAIINEGCLCGCPYQIVHQVHSSTISMKDASDYNGKFQFSNARCKSILESAPWLFLDANWILPRHIERYQGILDSFKLTDRTDSTDVIVKKVKAYFLHDYDHENLNPLITLMQHEDWYFPEKLLPDDFDQHIFSGMPVHETYYLEIWERLKNYNLKMNPRKAAAIHAVKQNKDALHQFEGEGIY